MDIRVVVRPILHSMKWPSVAVILAYLFAVQYTKAQILTTNLDFSNPSGTFYLDNTSTNYTVLPGWVVTFDPSAALYYSDYGNAHNQSGVPGYFGYISDATLETASASRGNVTAGLNYNVTFQLRNDYFSSTGGTVNVLWYASNNTTLLGSSSSGLLLAGSTAYNHSDPIQSFFLTRWRLLAQASLVFSGRRLEINWQVIFRLRPLVARLNQAVRSCSFLASSCC